MKNGEKQTIRRRKRYVSLDVYTSKWVSLSLSVFA